MYRGERPYLRSDRFEQYLMQILQKVVHVVREYLASRLSSEVPSVGNAGRDSGQLRRDGRGV